MFRKRPDWLPPWPLMVATVVVTIGSYFPVGYHMVLLNVPHETFRELIVNSYNDRYGGGRNHTLTEGQSASLWSGTVSSWQIGSLFGALGAFYLADRFGRNLTLMVVAGVLHLVGSIFMILMPRFEIFELLIIGRFLAGVSGGIVCPILHVFLSEISPDRYRGTLNSFAGFVLALGILLSMAFGLEKALGTPGDNLRSMVLLGFCLPMHILQIAAYPLFPSTPKFLYLTKKKEKEARASIEFYHGENADVKSVFDELEVERVLADQQLSIFRAIRLKSVRLPLCLSIVAGISNSSVGVDIGDAYSTELFTKLGLSSEASQLSSMGFNVAGIIGSTISIFVIDRFCRRTLLLSMLFVCFLCNVGMVFVGGTGRFVYDGKGGAGFGATTVVLIAIMELAYGIGPGAILEGLFAEVSPHKVRAAAGSLSKLAYCVTNWFFVFVYPPADVVMGAFAFLIHTVPSCFCMLYFAYYLPETGQKSVAQVAGEMMKRSKTMTKSVEKVAKKAHLKAEIVESKK